MFLHFIFPTYCPVCEKPTQTKRVCLGCEPQLVSIRHGTVPGLRTPLLACGNYASLGWRSAIHAGKFMGEQQLFSYIAQRMSTRKEIETYLHNSLLVPIPLHPQRLNERGYNQAEIIALTLGTTMHLPAAQMLKRRGSPHPQSQRASGEKYTAAFYFSVQRSQLPRSTRITLIDDVCTSGTTLRLAVSALHAEGYYNIQAFTFCLG
ncbi:MAG: hypothetical protein KIH62_003855 [Candidatus Kerfeldbacteria bacterium]|nr:hypothetical protein [Candidatus Kerfeldbacteria bacterium]